MTGWTSALEPQNPAATPKPPRKGSNSRLDRARRYVAKMDAAISGQNGHGATWSVARKCAADFELGVDDTLAVLREYNTRCQPPWSERELRHKAEEACNKARVANPVEDREQHWTMPTSHYTEPSGAQEYSDADAPDAPPHVPENKTPERIPDVIATVLDEWGTSGPLVHEPTGITRLDELTGGGPVYGTRWVITGQPDAGKTAFMLQIGHVYALRNISVGLMAVDEEAGDIVTRLAQRIGYARQHCELRDPLVLADMRVGLGGLPMYFYDATWTIENAAADLASRARATGSRAMLGVDSLQTVHCMAESIAQREMSEVSAVTARMHAIRNVATRYKLIAIATSEMGRSAYRSNDPTQQSTTLASAKWSGAVEYSARVLIGLRSVAGETDLIELELAKNKHGPRDEKVHLRIDRRSQTLTSAAYEPPPQEAVDRGAVVRDRVMADAAAIAKVLRGRPGLGVRELRGAMGAQGMGVARVESALGLLGEAVTRTAGARNSVSLSLTIERLPDDLRRLLDEAA